MNDFSVQQQGKMLDNQKNVNSFVLKSDYDQLVSEVSNLRNLYQNLEKQISQGTNTGNINLNDDSSHLGHLTKSYKCLKYEVKQLKSGDVLNRLSTLETEISQQANLWNDFSDYFKEFVTKLDKKDSKSDKIYSQMKMPVNKTNLSNSFDNQINIQKESDNSIVNELRELKNQVQLLSNETIPDRLIAVEKTVSNHNSLWNQFKANVCKLCSSQDENCKYQKELEGVHEQFTQLIQEIIQNNENPNSDSTLEQRIENLERDNKIKSTLWNNFSTNISKIISLDNSSPAIENNEQKNLRELSSQISKLLRELNHENELNSESNQDSSFSDIKCMKQDVDHLIERVDEQSKILGQFQENVHYLLHNSNGDGNYEGLNPQFAEDIRALAQRDSVKITTRDVQLEQLEIANGGNENERLSRLEHNVKVQEDLWNLFISNVSTAMTDSSSTDSDQYTKNREAFISMVGDIVRKNSNNNCSNTSNDLEYRINQLESKVRAQSHLWEQFVNNLQNTISTNSDNQKVQTDLTKQYDEYRSQLERLIKTSDNNNNNNYNTNAPSNNNSINQQALEEINDKVSKLEEKYDQDLKKIKDEIKQESQLLTNKFNALKSDIQEVDHKQTEAEKVTNDMIQNLQDQQQKQLQSVQKELSTSKKDIKTQQQNQKLQKDEIENIKKELTKYQQQNQNQEEEHHKFDEKLKIIQNAQQQQQSNFDKHQQDYQKLQKDLQKAKNYQTDLQKVQKAQQEQEKALKDYKEEQRQLHEDEHKQQEEAHQKLEEAIQKLETAQQTQDKAVKNCQNDLQKVQKSQQTNDKSVKNYKTDIQKLQTTQQEQDKALKDYQEEQRKLHEDEHKQQEEAHQKLEEAIQKLEKTQQTQDKAMKNCQSDLQKVQKSQQTNDKSVKNYKTDIQKLQTAQQEQDKAIKDYQAELQKLHEDEHKQQEEAHQKLEEAIQKLETAQQTQDKAVKNCQNDLQKVQKSQQTNDKSVKNYKTDIQKLQTTQQEQDKAIKDYQAELQKLQKAQQEQDKVIKDNFEEQRQLHEDQHKQQEEAHQKLEEAIQKLETAQQAQDKAVQNCQNDLQKVQKAQQTNDKSAKNYKTDIQKLQTAQQEQDKALKDYQEEQRQLHEDEHKQQEESIKKLNDSIQKLQAAQDKTTKNYQTELQKLQKTQQTQDKSVKNSQAELQKLQKAQQSQQVPDGLFKTYQEEQRKLHEEEHKQQEEAHQKLDEEIQNLRTAQQKLEKSLKSQQSELQKVQKAQQTQNETLQNYQEEQRQTHEDEHKQQEEAHLKLNEAIQKLETAQKAQEKTVKDCQTDLQKVQKTQQTNDKSAKNSKSDLQKLQTAQQEQDKAIKDYQAELQKVQKAQKEQDQILKNYQEEQHQLHEDERKQQEEAVQKLEEAVQKLETAQKAQEKTVKNCQTDLQKVQKAQQTQEKSVKNSQAELQKIQQAQQSQQVPDGLFKTYQEEQRKLHEEENKQQEEAHQKLDEEIQNLRTAQQKLEKSLKSQQSELQKAQKAQQTQDKSSKNYQTDLQKVQKAQQEQDKAIKDYQEEQRQLHEDEHKQQEEAHQKLEEAIQKLETAQQKLEKSLKSQQSELQKAQKAQQTQDKSAKNYQTDLQKVQKAQQEQDKAIKDYQEEQRQLYEDEHKQQEEAHQKLEEAIQKLETAQQIQDKAVKDCQKDISNVQKTQQDELQKLSSKPSDDSPMNQEDLQRIEEELKKHSNILQEHYDIFTGYQEEQRKHHEEDHKQLEEEHNKLEENLQKVQQLEKDVETHNKLWQQFTINLNGLLHVDSNENDPKTSQSLNKERENYNEQIKELAARNVDVQELGDEENLQSLAQLRKDVNLHSSILNQFVQNLQKLNIINPNEENQPEDEKAQEMLRESQKEFAHQIQSLAEKAAVTPGTADVYEVRETLNNFENQLSDINEKVNKHSELWQNYERNLRRLLNSSPSSSNDDNQFENEVRSMLVQTRAVNLDPSENQSDYGERIAALEKDVGIQKSLWEQFSKNIQVLANCDSEDEQTRKDLQSSRDSFAQQINRLVNNSNSNNASSTPDLHEHDERIRQLEQKVEVQTSLWSRFMDNVNGLFSSENNSPETREKLKNCQQDFINQMKSLSDPKKGGFTGGAPSLESYEQLVRDVRQIQSVLNIQREPNGLQERDANIDEASLSEHYANNPQYSNWNRDIKNIRSAYDFHSEESHPNDDEVSSSFEEPEYCQESSEYSSAYPNQYSYRINDGDDNENEEGNNNEPHRHHRKRSNSPNNNDGVSPARRNSNDNYNGVSPTRGNANDNYNGVSPARGNANDNYNGVSQARGNANDNYNGASPARGNINDNYNGASQARGNFNDNYNGASPAGGNNNDNYNGVSPIRRSSKDNGNNNNNNGVSPVRSGNNNGTPSSQNYNDEVSPYYNKNNNYYNGDAPTTRDVQLNGAGDSPHTTNIIHNVNNGPIQEQLNNIYRDLKCIKYELKQIKSRVLGTDFDAHDHPGSNDPQIRTRSAFLPNPNSNYAGGSEQQVQGGGILQDNVNNIFNDNDYTHEESTESESEGHEYTTDELNKKIKLNKKDISRLQRKFDFIQASMSKQGSLWNQFDNSLHQLLNATISEMEMPTNADLAKLQTSIKCIKYEIKKIKTEEKARTEEFLEKKKVQEKELQYEITQLVEEVQKLQKVCAKFNNFDDEQLNTKKINDSIKCLKHEVRNLKKGSYSSTSTPEQRSTSFTEQPSMQTRKVTLSDENRKSSDNNSNSKFASQASLDEWIMEVKNLRNLYETIQYNSEIRPLSSAPETQSNTLLMSSEEAASSSSFIEEKSEFSEFGPHRKTGDSKLSQNSGQPQAHEIYYYNTNPSSDQVKDQIAALNNEIRAIHSALKCLKHEIKKVQYEINPQNGANKKPFNATLLSTSSSSSSQERFDKLNSNNKDQSFESRIELVEKALAKIMKNNSRTQSTTSKKDNNNQQPDENNQLDEEVRTLKAEMKQLKETIARQSSLTPATVKSILNTKGSTPESAKTDDAEGARIIQYIFSQLEELPRLKSEVEALKQHPSEVITHQRSVNPKELVVDVEGENLNNDKDIVLEFSNQNSEDLSGQSKTVNLRQLVNDVERLKAQLSSLNGRIDYISKSQSPKDDTLINGSLSNLSSFIYEESSLGDFMISDQSQSRYEDMSREVDNLHNEVKRLTSQIATIQEIVSSTIKSPEDGEGPELTQAQQQLLQQRQQRFDQILNDLNDVKDEIKAIKSNPLMVSDASSVSSVNSTSSIPGVSKNEGIAALARKYKKLQEAQNKLKEQVNQLVEASTNKSQAGSASPKILNDDSANSEIMELRETIKGMKLDQSRIKKLVSRLVQGEKQTRGLNDKNKSELDIGGENKDTESMQKNDDGTNIDTLKKDLSQIKHTVAILKRETTQLVASSKNNNSDIAYLKSQYEMVRTELANFAKISSVVSSMKSSGTTGTAAAENPKKITASPAASKK